MKNFIFPGAFSEMDTYPLLFSLRAYPEGEQRSYRSVCSFFGGEVNQIREGDLQPGGTPLQAGM